MQHGRAGISRSTQNVRFAHLPSNPSSVCFQVYIYGFTCITMPKAQALFSQIPRFLRSPVLGFPGFSFQAPTFPYPYFPISPCVPRVPGFTHLDMFTGCYVPLSLYSPCVPRDLFTQQSIFPGPYIPKSLNSPRSYCKVILYHCLIMRGFTLDCDLGGILMTSAVALRLNIVLEEPRTMRTHSSLARLLCVRYSVLAYLAKLFFFLFVSFGGFFWCFLCLFIL